MSRRRTSLGLRWLQIAGVALVLGVAGCAIEGAALAFGWLVAR
jgi:hypothetical protein